MFWYSESEQEISQCGNTDETAVCLCGTSWNVGE